MHFITSASWQTLLCGILCAFFLLGSVVNFRAPKPIAELYLKWGYPSWFHFVTAALELTTAVCLAFAGTRLVGVVLGCLIMAAAVITVVAHRDYPRAVLPTVVFLLVALLGCMARRACICTVGVALVSAAASAAGLNRC
jgi:hypothetical protein